MKTAALTFLLFVSLASIASAQFPPGMSFRSYGANNSYQGFYRENPHNHSISSYNKYNQLQNRYVPNQSGSRYSVYDQYNRYEGYLQSKQTRAESYQLQQQMLRQQYNARHYK